MNQHFLKRSVLVVMMLALGALTSFAQQIPVTGTVTDEKGEPLAGVAVMIQGQATGAVTGVDGKYSINVEKGKNLDFSFIGFNSQVITVGNNSVIDVVLKEDALLLDDVVVIGYGTQKKSHLTGSVAKVETEGLADIPVTNVTQALVGKVAGMNIQNNTSLQGDTPDITIRGAGSITASSAPLVVIDGFPAEGGLNSVNSADIESIEVLKDAASAAIYGSRASGGVILITTKAGDERKPVYNVKVTGGVSRIYKRPDKYNYTDYLNMMRDVKTKYDAVFGPAKVYNNDTIEAGANLINIVGETDWIDAITQNAQFRNVQASVAGGSAKARYYISANYGYNQGTMIHNENTKISIRAKLDAKLSDRVSVGVQFAPQYQKYETPGATFENTVRTPPYIPIYHTEETVAGILAQNPEFAKKPGDYAQGKDWQNMKWRLPDGTEKKITNIWGSNDNSPFEIINKTHNTTSNYSMTGSAYLTIKIIDGLTFKTSNGVNYRYRENNKFLEENCKKGGLPAENTWSNNMYVNLLTENTFNYDKKFGKHAITALAGYTAEYTKINTAQIYGTFANNYVYTLNAATAIDPSKTKTGEEEIAMQSVLARVTYAYDDKYLLSASWRMDGSSKFGPDNRWGQFPSVSIGWRASQEPWMQKINWISNLKFRASYGITGNDNITNYAPYNVVNLVQYITGAGIGSVISGFANTSTALGNRALGWEQTNQFNVGLDFSVLKGRLGITADYYNSTTKALLLQEKIPSITGFATQWNNIGKIQNTGLELEINAVPITNSNFEWTIAANFAKNNNKVLDLGGADEIINTGERSEKYLTRVGEPITQFYMLKTDGVIMTQEEVNAQKAAGYTSAALGALKIVQSTPGAGLLDVENYTVVGNPTPDFTYGMTNTFKIKNFDIQFTLQGQHGGEFIEGDMNYGESRKWIRQYDYKNSWFADADGLRGNGKVPAASGGVNWMLTDYVVHDSSFISLRNFTLGYSLSNKAIKKLHLGGLRFYLSGDDLFFFWPDTRIGMANPIGRNKTAGSVYKNPLVSGYTRGTYPLVSTYTIGIDLKF